MRKMKEDVIFKIAFHNSMGQSCKLHLEMEEDYIYKLHITFSILGF